MIFVVVSIIGFLTFHFFRYYDLYVALKAALFGYLTDLTGENPAALV